MFRVFSYLYTHLSLHCGHVQLCDMSVSNPFVTPIHNGTTSVNMVILLQDGCMCVLKDIIDVHQFLDKNLTSFIIPVLSYSVEKFIYDGLSKISNFQATLNALISHINFSMCNILVFLRTHFP